MRSQANVNTLDEGFIVIIFYSIFFSLPLAAGTLRRDGEV